MRSHRLAALACTIALAACNEGPFVDHDLVKNINKPVDTILDSGTVHVCYDDDRLGEAEMLAKRTCAAYGLQAVLTRIERYQCRLTTPHRASFRCIHPDLVDGQGEPINPFDAGAVAAWSKRTGKQPPASMRRNPEAPTPSADGASPFVPSPGLAPEPPPAALVPTPTPVPPSAPAPADIPTSPRPPEPAPIAVPAPLDAGGFTLPVGTWGDAFDAQQ